jgi:hypothetical protein
MSVSQLLPDEAAFRAPEPAIGSGAKSHVQSSPRSKRAVRRAIRKPPARGHDRFLVLACADEDTIALDLATGAVIRLRIAWPEGVEPVLAPFDVVEALIASDPERDDLAQPEAVTLASTPSSLGPLRGRQVRKMLKRVAAPAERKLLGFAGTSLPYVEFRGMRPSVAMVTPSRGPVIFRRRSDSTVWARFGWPRSDNWLPVEDRRTVAALWASRRDKLSGKDLANALGFKPRYVLVALSRPRDGHCYKVVNGLLPRG